MNRANPISAAVVRAALASNAREVFNQFVRTALTPTIYDAFDFSVAIFDDQCNVVADASGLPEYVGSLTFTVERLVEQFGRENLADGDVLVSSDPYITGAHPPDMAIISPAFHDGQLIGFCAVRGHVGDVGARNDYPADARSVYEEGLVLPPMKLVSRGVLNSDVIDIVAANSRMPRETVGNIRAAIGATHQGAIKLAKIVAAQGEPSYRLGIAELLDGSETRVRALVEELPDGDYFSTDVLDHDAIDDQPIALACRVRIRGSDIEVDVTGSAPQHYGALNVPYAQTVAACRLALKRFTIQDSVPANSGEYRCLSVVAPPGNIFNAQTPVGTFMMHVTASILSEMVVNALLPVIKDRAPAPSGGHTTAFSAGFTTRDGRHMASDDAAAIGYGALRGQDGANALQHFSISGIATASAEVWEATAPMLKERISFVVDSGGPGRWRGGLGTQIVWRFETEANLTLQAQRTGDQRAPGLDGGYPGAGRNDVQIAAGLPHERSYGMATDVRLRAGETVVLNGAGGAGFGNPRDRDPETVELDVRCGYVSMAAAREYYGVVIDPATGLLDRTATSVLRGEGPGHDA
ncbi:hydantoinase B/oxoprolinase family protein [soil metagenome]